MKPWKFFKVAALMIRLARGAARSRSSCKGAAFPTGPVNALKILNENRVSSWQRVHMISVVMEDNLEEIEPLV